MKIPNKPGITRDRVEILLKQHGLDLEKEKVVLVGVRGYFRNTMGKKGKNDIGMWDDGFVWIDLQNCITFNGNTDPSRFYNRVATLATGIWTYKKGWHGYGKKSGHNAFRQAAPVYVNRWQPGGTFVREKLGDTINIHRGGYGTTSSAGCQTLPPSQWAAFKEYGYMILSKYEKKTFKYLLVENDGSIA